MLPYNLLTYPFERHGVEILAISHFDTTEIKAHYSREIAHEFVSIRAIEVPVPRDTIEGVILMSVHITFLLYLSKTLNQFLPRCLFPGKSVGTDT